MDSSAITAFAIAPIPPSNILNMLIVVILATGVFQLKYSKWHALSAEQRTILNAWDW